MKQELTLKALLLTVCTLSACIACDSVGEGGVSGTFGGKGGDTFKGGEGNRIGGGAGGTSSGGGGNTIPIASFGSLTLGVTGTPVNDATKIVKVVVEFAGVEVKPADGKKPVVIVFSPLKQIDFLDLGLRGVRELILDNKTLPTGRYNSIRLKVNAQQGVRDSSIERTDGGQPDLDIPSGEETGLTLNREFDVPVGGHVDFTIAIDLRQSVLKGPGEDYMLKPTFRIIDNTEAGSIAGTVNPLLGLLCTISGGGVTYVFEGADIIPDDIDQVPPEP
jgi:hypothetical protein